MGVGRGSEGVYSRSLMPERKDRNTKKKNVDVL
jgi:hypothetical protein